MISMREQADSSIVRDYTTADGAGVLQLWRAVFRQSFPYLDDSPSDEDFRLYFEKVMTKWQRIWVAAQGESVAGFVSATEDEICNLFVAVDRQRRGLGTALLNRALLERPGIRLASTLAANLGARKFYEKNGFILVRTEPHSFAGQQAAIYRRE